jgi:hypothetical protein
MERQSSAADMLCHHSLLVFESPHCKPHITLHSNRRQRTHVSVCVPPPHVAEHAPADHADTTQLTGLCAVQQVQQYGARTRDTRTRHTRAHATTHTKGCCCMERQSSAADMLCHHSLLVFESPHITLHSNRRQRTHVSVCVPPPHVAEHAPADHADTTQLTGLCARRHVRAHNARQSTRTKHWCCSFASATTRRTPRRRTTQRPSLCASTSACPCRTTPCTYSRRQTAFAGN